MGGDSILLIIFLMIYSLSMINVEITKTGSENNTSALRKFTKRVQGSGVLNRVRSLRYKERLPSKYTKKKKALKKIIRRAEIDRLIKLGKMTEKAPR